MTDNRASAASPTAAERPPARPWRAFSLNLASLAPRLLRTRLALTYAGLAVLVMAVLGWSLAGTVKSFSIAQLSGDLTQRAVVAADILESFFSQSESSQDLPGEVGELARALDANVTVVGPDGSVLADSITAGGAAVNQIGRPEIRDAMSSGSGISQRAGGGSNEPYLYAARRIGNSQAVVRLGIPLNAADELVRDIRRQIALAALAAAVLMSAAGWFVASRIVSALDDLRTQATAVATGTLDVAVVPVATRELGDLGRAFNVMTGRLRRTVAELEQTRLRLEATLANLSDGVLITDDRGRVVLANAAARAMLAIPGPIANEPFVEVVRDHELTEMVNAALTGSREVQEQVIRHGRSGRLLQAAARRLDASNERIGVVVLRDITELRRLEEVRRDFVANVSHELRTPLTSIRALVETLEAGAIDDPTVSSDFLARIVSEVDRLAAMVDELLDLARLESGRLHLSIEGLEPHALIERAVERLAPQIERAGLQVEMVAPTGTMTVAADRSRIDQVLLNLVHNAIKFTPRGGSISLSAQDAGQMVEFQVRDTGVGVNPADMPRLFERFYKTDRARSSQGTGLGLAIAKHIVQAHGGTIWAEPNPGGGTVFVFRLPAAGTPGAESADATVIAVTGASAVA